MWTYEFGTKTSNHGTFEYVHSLAHSSYHNVNLSKFQRLKISFLARYRAEYKTLLACSLEKGQTE